MAEHGTTATQAAEPERGETAALWLAWLGRAILVVGVAVAVAALMVLPDLRIELGRSWSLLLAALPLLLIVNGLLAAGVSAVLLVARFRRP